MKVSYRDLQDAELNAKLAELKQELFNLRFSHATGQLTNPHADEKMQERHSKNKDRYSRARACKEELIGGIDNVGNYKKQP